MASSLRAGERLGRENSDAIDECAGRLSVISLRSCSVLGLLIPARQEESVIFLDV